MPVSLPKGERQKNHKGVKANICLQAIFLVYLGRFQIVLVFISLFSVIPVG